MSEVLLPFVEVCTRPNPTACVIWMHGLGDSGHGFAPIVKELKLPESLAVRFLFPHAPERPVTINNGMQMRAWYDIKSFDFNSRADLAGVQESAAAVSRLVDNQISQGIAAERIVLGGFSQGGVIALHLGTRIKHKLAGIMALSTYMCEPDKLAAQASDTNKTTPIMMAHGDHDEVVPHFLGNAAYKILADNGFNATWTTYNMQHNVCYQEIQDIASWLEKVFC
ncbi:alpha/beta fold hydrolase [Alteromonas pelagimontana]|uniref:Alpha/beta fold hydrolase n=1 Tax=Alteromonas pelagimontana TaxID=1858656 RepID=A0A6M4MDG9_9ALTE|nr:alpha/beta hydrolase fold domain-containing protein [Alteromonas pelagimontana]QJR81139.1 alpha/beta fold hydrolase [Alteromonas pelagimontana]